MKRIFLLLAFSSVTLSFAQNIRFNPNFGGVGKEIRINRQGTILALLTFENIEFWDAVSGKQLFYNSLPGSMSVPHIWGFNESSDRFFYSNNDSLYILDLLHNRVLHRFFCKEEVFSIIGDGKEFITNAFSELRIYDAATGILTKSFKLPFSGCTTISADGRYMLVYDKGQIRMRDIRSGRETLELNTGSDKQYTMIAIGNDLKRIAAGTGDGVIDIYDIRSEKLAATCHTGSKPRKIFFNLSDEYLVTADGNGQVKVFNAGNGELLQTIRNSENLGVQDNYVTASARNLAITGAKSTRLYNFRTGKPEREIVQALKMDKNMKCAISPDERSLLLLTDSLLIHWDLQKFVRSEIASKEAGILNKENKYTGFENVIYLPDGKGFILSGRSGVLDYYDAGSLKLVKSIDTKRSESAMPNTVLITPDGKYIVAVEDIYRPYDFFEISTGRLAFSLPVATVLAWAFPADLSRIYTADWAGDIKAFEYGTDKLICSFRTPEMPVSVAISPDKKYVAAIDYKRQIVIADYQTGKVVTTITALYSDAVAPVSGMKLSFSDNSKILVYQEKNKRHFINTATWQSQPQSSDKDYALLFAGQLAEKPNLIPKSEDYVVNVYNKMETGIVCSFMNAGSDWICFTPDGYFDASKRGGEIATMVKGTSGFGVDQFATYYNRPDLVMQKFGSPDKAVAGHFHKQYLKRLRKLKLPDVAIQNDFHLPLAEISGTAIQENRVILDLSFSDSKYSLKNYNIFVNDVPVFGTGGKTLSGNSANVRETVQLSRGENKIEVSCTNDQGTESYRPLTLVQNNEDAGADLYVVAFGVSKYNDPTLNLHYADKDALDIEQVAKKFNGKGFQNVFSEILINERVTTENIKAAKDFLKDSKPDDVFILFIAGHGMYDRDAENTYYFLTCNTDLNNLKGTAADFETIEDLLQGVPARNKLFLMDACESGELDEELYENMADAGTLTGEGVSSRGIKSLNNTKVAVAKRNFLHQKDRYIYNDLSRRSGAIVFSSSRGGELSYERSDIQNGLFTFFIKQALTTQEADVNRDGMVSTDELRNYVSHEVSEASNGMQNPTVDRDNIYQKFGFAVK